MKIVLSDRVKAVVEERPLPDIKTDDHAPLPAYPNEAGMVKCVYCFSYRDHRCTQGHEPDGISLLRECGGFGFNRAAYDDFYANLKGCQK